MNNTCALERSVNRGTGRRVSGGNANRRVGNSISALRGSAAYRRLPRGTTHQGYPGRNGNPGRRSKSRATKEQLCDLINTRGIGNICGLTKAQLMLLPEYGALPDNIKNRGMRASKADLCDAMVTPKIVQQVLKGSDRQNTLAYTRLLDELRAPCNTLVQARGARLVGDQFLQVQDSPQNCEQLINNIDAILPNTVGVLCLIAHANRTSINCGQGVIMHNTPVFQQLCEAIKKCLIYGGHVLLMACCTGQINAATRAGLNAGTAGQPINLIPQDWVDIFNTNDDCLANQIARTIPGHKVWAIQGFDRPRNWYVNSSHVNTFGCGFDRDNPLPFTFGSAHPTTKMHCFQHTP